MSLPLKNRKALSLLAVGSVIALTVSACGSNGIGGANAPAPIVLGEYFTHPTDVEVPGLTGQRVESSIGVNARWDYLPGEQDFNPFVAELVDSHIQKHAEYTEQFYAPEAHDEDETWLERGCVSGSTTATGQEILSDPELSQQAEESTVLTIACDSVLASGSNYGELFRFVRGNVNEVQSDTSEIVYTNTDSGEVSRGKDLFTSEGIVVLYDTLYDLLDIEKPMSGDEPAEPSQEVLDGLQDSLSNVSFAEGGDIHVTVDRDMVAILAISDPEVVPESATLVIPHERAEELLNPLGQEISRSMAAGEQWSGSEPVPSGKEYVDCDLVPCVAVTYDDGPSPLTHDVLDVYAERDYAATTFFVIGQSIPGNEEIVKRAVDEGHEVGNHSFTHPALTTLSADGIAQEINDTNKLIEEATGVAATNHRPPYGDYNEESLKITDMPTILWTVDTLDWKKPGLDHLMNEAVHEAEPDDIILMHDIHEETVAAAADIADGLLQRGFTLVTINQLFAGEGKPAKAYWTIDGDPAE